MRTVVTFGLKKGSANSQTNRFIDFQEFADLSKLQMNDEPTNQMQQNLLLLRIKNLI